MLTSDPLNYNFAYVDKAIYGIGIAAFPPFPSFIDKKDKKKGLSIPTPQYPWIEFIDISILKQDIVFMEGIDGKHPNHHLFFEQGLLKLTLMWGNIDYIKELTAKGVKVKVLKKLKKGSFLELFWENKGYSLRVIKMIAQSILHSNLNKSKNEEITTLGRNLNFINLYINNFLANGNVCGDLITPMNTVKKQLREREMSEEDSYLTPIIPKDKISSQFEPKPSSKTAPQISKPSILSIFYNLITNSPQKIPNSAEQKVPNSAEQKVPNSAEQKVPNLAEQKVPNSAEQKIPNSAEQKIPNSAEQKIPNSAEQKIPNSAEQKIPNSADQKVPNADVLLKMRDEDFLNFYHNHNFNIQDFLLNTYGWKDVFFRLIKLKHKITIKSLIESPEASRKFYNESLTNQSIREEPTFEAWFSTYKQMMNIRFVPQDKTYELFRTAMFITENRESMAKSQIGSLSPSRAGVLKIKNSDKKGGFKIPFEMDYHFTNGDIIVRLGYLNKGAFRVINKYLSLGNLRVEAYSKQKIEAQNNLNENQVKAMAEKEMSILKEFKGVPNVLQLHEYTTYISQKKGRTIVSSRNEFYCLQDLSISYQTLTPLQRRKIACDIIKGVKAIHSKGIIHRDLKLANIFLTKVIDSNGIILKDQNKDEVLEAVVGDFGFACRGTEDPDCSVNAGSRLYMSPQKWANEKSKFADDFWAVGVLLGQLYNQKQFSVPVRTLLNARNVAELLWAIDSLKDISLNPEPKNINSIEYVVWKLLQHDLSKRMNLNEALALETVSGITIF